MRITNTAAALACVTLLSASFSAVADTQSPSVPGNVSAAASNGSAVIVSWNGSSDNTGVDGYNVYRNGSYYATVFGSTRYTDQNANSGTSYQYAVVAFDAARNYSSISSSASANGGTAAASSGSSTAATQQSVASGTPAAPGNLSVNAAGNSSATLSWNAPSGGATGYNVYQNDNYVSTVNSGTSYTANSLSSGNSYSFYVVAIRGGAFSPKSSPVNFTMNGGASASASNEASPPPQNASAQSSNSQGVPAGYQLVFSDEFNGGGINASRWNTAYRWGPNWTINNEEQYYVDTLNNGTFGSGPFVNDGNNLTIRATRTPENQRGSANGKSYLSGAMTTFGKFRMTYGYVEMRAKLPRGKGLWPAFWLLHEANDRNRPEIDVMEMLGNNTSLVYQTYHFYNNGNLQSTPSFQAPGPDYASSFHTFGMKWEPGRITWYVDGVATNTYASGNVPSESMYILVNLAIGGAWAGSPDGSTSFPADFQIDYIRAYQ